MRFGYLGVMLYAAQERSSRAYGKARQEEVTSEFLAQDRSIGFYFDAWQDARSVNIIPRYRNHPMMLREIAHHRAEYGKAVLENALQGINIYHSYREHRNTFLVDVSMPNNSRNVNRIVNDIVKEEIASDTFSRSDVAQMLGASLAMQGNIEDAAFLVEDYLSMMGRDDDIATMEDIIDSYNSGKGLK